MVDLVCGFVLLAVWCVAFASFGVGACRWFWAWIVVFWRVV